MSNHAETAKMIRKELKKAFPKIKFRVTSDRYAGGSSVNISWLNGPVSSDVNKVVHKYQYGHFDGQTDCYDVDSSRDDIPQVQYVQVNREIEEDIKEKVFAWLQRTHVHFDEVFSIDEYSPKLQLSWNVCTPREFIYRVLVKMDLTNGFNEPNEVEQ